MTGFWNGAELRPLLLITASWLCFGAVAHSQVALPSDVAVQRLEHLLAHRRDRGFRTTYEQTLQTAPGSVPVWMSSLFFSTLYPICPDGPCLDARMDPAEKFAGYLKGAEAGNANLYLIVGVYDLYGMGVEKNIAEGVKWIKKAASSGNYIAQYALAQMYEVGALVPADEPKAIELYKEATQNAIPFESAMLRLGEIYEFGTVLGTAPNYRLALHWYELAAAEHDRSVAKFVCPPACFGGSAAESLGSLYALGRGVTRDYAAAAGWFLKATSHGLGYGGENWVAQCALAIMYAGGVGVTQDLERSAFWLNRPNTNGADECRQ